MSTKGGSIQSTDAIRVLVYSAICLALAFVLSNITIFRMPQGGSVTLASMLFIALIGYWFGIRAGLIAGIVFGYMRMTFGGYVITPMQGLLDYVVAYAALGGFSGVFSGKRFGSYGLYIGYLVGVTGTFLSQVASGVIFFSHFAPEGQHVLIFSAIYNLSHNLPEVILTFAILALPNFKHALETVAPKGSVSHDNAFSRTMREKAIMRRLPYAVASAALFISFFIFPLVHGIARRRPIAAGYDIAAGTGGLFEYLGYSGYPLVFLLLAAPAVMFVLTILNKSAKTLFFSAIGGFLIKLGFICGALIILGADGYRGVYGLTMSNWIILAIFIGLIFSLKKEAFSVTN